MAPDCIILGGGLGTRLRETVPDLPKSMAPVAGRPFLSWVIDHFRMQGIERFIFSLGYKSEAVIKYLEEQYPTLDYQTVVEDTPLGTGGGIRLAIERASTEDVLVANGDTLYRIDLSAMTETHHRSHAVCTLALKPMKAFDRYGLVEINTEGKILSFREKQPYKEGLINGGVYLLQAKAYLQSTSPSVFSFEKDFLEKYCSDGIFYGSVQDRYFIDIGIPEDFNKANLELLRPPLDLSAIDKSWTLFLDRDGVINDEKVGNYVLEWKQFIFSKGVLDMFRKLSEVFGRIIIVSNQRGVGRGLMKEETLQTIHLEMKREVEIVGGRIDAIYYCKEADERCFYRKPNPGMAFKAMRDFPPIDPSRSIMVGNKPGDMRFGRSAGFYTVFVRTTNPDQAFPHPDIDGIYPSLYDFASAL
jgi:D-glycero-alpha-D-manno-heptose 1-phosphate guanylyltransferase